MRVELLDRRQSKVISVISLDDHDEVAAKSKTDVAHAQYTVPDPLNNKITRCEVCPALQVLTDIKAWGSFYSYKVLKSLCGSKYRFHEIRSKTCVCTSCILIELLFFFFQLHSTDLGHSGTRKVPIARRGILSWSRLLRSCLWRNNA